MQILSFSTRYNCREAEYGDPYQPSVGISHVLVAGRPVVTDGKQVEGRYPGRHLLGSHDNELTK